MEYEATSFPVTALLTGIAMIYYNMPYMCGKSGERMNYFVADPSECDTANGWASLDIQTFWNYRELYYGYPTGEDGANYNNWVDPRVAHDSEHSNYWAMYVAFGAIQIVATMFYIYSNAVVVTYDTINAVYLKSRYR